MIEWWSTLSTVMKILWGVTLSASVIFVIQSILTFVGADADFNTDFDADVSSIDGADGDSGMGLLTFRNFVNFFLGFGWTFILLHDQIESGVVLMIVAAAIGVGLVAVVMLLFKWISGMQQSGNIDIRRSAEGCAGKVYLSIPANRQGKGKVQISINNSVREYEAVTDSDEMLKTGTDITVIEAVSDDTVLVEKAGTLIV